MSTRAKIAYLIAFLLLVSAFAVQLMTGMWLNLNSILLASSAVVAAFAIWSDRRLFWEFFTMRTTKHGLNMGAMIVLVVALLVCVNYLANKHNKTWDVTKERLNSLSEQSQKVLDGLKQDLDCKIFYKGPSANEEKNRIKNTLLLYQSSSSRFRVRFINAYVEQQEALRYMTDQTDRENVNVMTFVEYGGKKVRVEEPFDEAAITSALIKVTREGEAKIYFIKGHGERDLESDNDQGLKDLFKALGESSFKAESLSLIDKKEIPADASVVAIVGPSMPYLDEELSWLRAYLRRGGRLFMALDPGQRQNLANLTKTFGVEFENNYVLTLAPIAGAGPATILGRNFDASSDITKSLPNGATFAVFPLSSEVKAAPDKASDIQVRDLVKSDNYGFTMTDISRPLTTKPPTQAITLAVEAKGMLPPPPAEVKKKGEKAEAEPSSPAKEFSAVVFGDSDFISNRALLMGANRDLALNSIASLANQKDLLSIRPKLPKGTALVLTSFSRWMVIILGMALPVLLLIISGVMWFRRRGA